MSSVQPQRRRTESPGDGDVLLTRLHLARPLLDNAAETADATGHIAETTWAALRHTGLLRAALPQSEGGIDLIGATESHALVAALRYLGATDLSLARIVEGHINAIGLVRRYGTAAQIADLSNDVRDGALSAVWGADGGTPLRAEPEGDRYRLRGGKILASGAGFVRRPLVTASTPEGSLLILLRLEPGLRTDASGWTATGMRSTATGTVDCDNLLVGRDAVIGAPGDFMRQPTFSGGAWRFCAAHLGAAERLLDLFRAHLVSRKREGDPYQLERISHCVAAVTTAAFWVEAAAARLADENRFPAADTVAFVNLTRGVTERAALDVLEAVHRGIGLLGMMRPHPVERIARDLATYLRQPVPDLAMADAARAVLASDRPVAELWLAS